MSPIKKEIELGEALFIQKVKANNLITLEKDAREILDVGIGDRVICYEGPWEGSIVLMASKKKDSLR